MRSRRVIALGMLVSVAGSAALLGATQPEKAPGRSPVVSISGSYSEVSRARFDRVNSDGRMKEIWLEHMGPRAEKSSSGSATWPRVDFGKYMVLCIFTGKVHSTNGIEIMEISDRGADLLVRYDKSQYQTLSFGNEPTPDYSGNAYGFFVMEKSERPIVLEENVQNLIGGEPVWKEVGRLRTP